MNQNYQTNWIPSRCREGFSELQVMTKSGRLVAVVKNWRQVDKAIAAFEKAAS